MRKKLISILVILGFLIVASFLIVNSSISYFLKSMLDGNSASQAAILSATDNQTSEQMKETVQVKTTENKESVSSEKSTESHADTPTALQNEKTPETTKGGSEKLHEANKSPNTGPDNKGTNADNESHPYSATISKDKAEKVKDEITIAEKAKVTSMLLSKLSPSELKLFAQMAANGLSIEEKKEAKKIILNKLSEDEYNQLIGIAAKYGLSQGKNYAESKKQDLSTKQDSSTTTKP